MKKGIPFSAVARNSGSSHSHGEFQKKWGDHREHEQAQRDGQPPGRTAPRRGA
jgi:hypothetical protein